MRAPVALFGLGLITATLAFAQQAAPTPEETAAATPAAPAPEVPAPEAPAPCPPPRWPEGTLPDARAEVAGARPEAIAALETWAFSEHTPEQEAARQGVRTDALLVMQGGRVLYERYARGQAADAPHLTWSVSKSFVNTLVGLAVRDGLLSLDDSICRFVQTSQPQSCDIQVRHLLEFSSGLDWRETYEGEPPTTSSVIAMLYGEGHGDMARFVADHPRRAPPGTLWQYSSGDTTLLAAVVGRALEPRYGREFAWEALFKPLGMQSVVWERDGAGTLVGSSLVYATARDLARLGHLWLDRGCWDGAPLLPAGWVEDSTRVSGVIRQGGVGREPGDSQGRQFWLNQAVPEQGDTTRPWPDAPPDTFAAMGHWKQGILVVPSADLVIVRLGDDRDGSFSWNTLLKLSLALGEPGLAVEEPAGSSGPAAARVEADVRKYDASLLRVGAGYGASLACSCAFVMQRDDSFCAAWVKASPDVVNVRIDREARTVTASALGLVRAKARWVGEHEGCVLD